MKAICCLCRHYGRIILGLGILSLIAAIALGGDVKKKREKDSAVEQAAKRSAKEAAEMVEAIANRNKQPKIVSRRNVKPKNFALFAEDYDWKEEERVKGALDKLSRNESVELWEALVQKANDRRYCIVSYSWSSDDAERYSVGRMCRKLAYDRLCSKVFEEHLPSIAPFGCPIRLRSIEDDFLAWRKDRKEKSLYQLQIEVCEMAIRELPKVSVHFLSGKEKSEARKKIEAEITELRRLKRPHIGKTGIPPAYPERAAKRVREAFEKGSLEHLGLRLSR